MGKINSYQKGARYERQIRDFFKENGYDEAYRSNQFQGNHKQGSPDVSETPYLHVECKHVERLNIHNAMEQAIEDAELQGEGEIPVVFHTKNHKKDLVTMEQSDWFKLYNAYVREMGD